jgi:hypothetical protein
LDIRLQYFQIYAAPAVGIQCHWTVPRNTGCSLRGKLRASFEPKPGSGTIMQQDAACKFSGTPESHIMMWQCYTQVERARSLIRHACILLLLVVLRACRPGWTGVHKSVCMPACMNRHACCCNSMRASSRTRLEGRATWQLVAGRQPTADKT